MAKHARTARGVSGPQGHRPIEGTRNLRDAGGYLGGWPRAAVVHCTMGKDRSGLVAALVQSLAGVDRSHIVAGYTLSESFAGSLATDAEERTRLNGQRTEALLPMAERRPEVMERTLDHLENRHGDRRRCLGTIGVSGMAVGALREALLTGASHADDVASNPISG